MEVTVSVTVNGIAKYINTEPDRSILDVLRDDLQTTGSWPRCGVGRCGGCVVLLDGQRVLACDTPIIDADQHVIQSVE